ncbi:MAG TPA: TlpA disulfide reductase family protein [Fimbriimonadaceae bacterium]
MRVCTVIAVTIVTQIVLGQSLTVGSPAPALKVSRWIKGTPVANFEKGKTYVVEFWATWCAPCREAMPHLTEMAKKYAGKVTFTGCDIFERFSDEAATNKAVDSFVSGMGDKMGYNVCQDGPAHTMVNTWMKPTLQDGIPCSFVIDGSGKVAWIGHPMELDAALSQILAGTFDAKKFEAQFKAYQEQ